jgi:hypothetical protein
MTAPIVLPDTAIVVTIGDVDHDPAPLDVATACGIWLRVDYSTNRPQGTACPRCFGDPT